ncbi:GNAT family N-acetyltransferase [Haloferax sp. S1W]|uniref:GNAT family N-acetyltransferase n=1 Tax=Haloferax sp. S1W TaxID=3377110 RepID=UPI0037CAAF6F
MSDKFAVRPPQSPAEMRGVHRVNARCWVEAYDHILPDDVLPDPEDEPDEAWLREQFDYATILNQTESGRYVVAVDESASRASGDDGSDDDAARVVGFAATRWGNEAKDFVGDDEAGLWTIYVDPSRWGKGIGSRLLETVTAAIPARFDRLVLETFAENEVGQRFYQSKGFEVVEEFETEVGDESYPAVLMARSLRD